MEHFTIWHWLVVLVVVAILYLGERANSSGGGPPANVE
jgi:hypothetical protein